MGMEMEDTGVPYGTGSRPSDGAKSTFVSTADAASIPNARPVCVWCSEPFVSMLYQGKRRSRCTCYRDFRSPVEKRRDAVLEKYGDDPTAYTPQILAELARDGLFDIAAAFCPAGKLTMAETRAREAQGIEAGTAETVQQGSVHESPVAESDAPTPSPDRHRP